jgi:hypothetical protein
VQTTTHTETQASGQFIISLYKFHGISLRHHQDRNLRGSNSRYALLNKNSESFYVFASSFPIYWDMTPRQSLIGSRYLLPRNVGNPSNTDTASQTQLSRENLLSQPPTSGWFGRQLLPVLKLMRNTKYYRVTYVFSFLSLDGALNEINSTTETS